MSNCPSPEKCVVIHKNSLSLSLSFMFKKCTLRRGLLETTLCDKICERLATSLWFSPGTTGSSTNKSDRHDMTEKLLKVALSTITLTSSRNVLLTL